MNRTESDHTLELDPDNPWLGLSSYTEASRAYFHGRDEEAAELARRVQRKNLTILFGQSGLGKTSLLRAGLVPRLRPQGYCPVYVRVDYAPDSPTPAEQIKQAIRTETTREGVWTRKDNTAEGESLWEFLHHRGDLLRDAGGRPLVPLLIFDQFEEVFTLAQADDAGRARAQAFLSQLADLVENRPPEALEKRLEDDDSIIEDYDFARADYRILIALREDYLAHLESIKDLMPSITQNRMRLARMTGPQALSAVVEPGGKLVSREVAEAIVRFVAGGSELANAEIEPSLLSLVCRELNTTRIAQGRPEISADLLAGSRDTILSEFYERALADQPPGVRRVIEDELLTESGYRESLAEERVRKALDEAGASPDALANLVNRRLLRIEDRLDMRRVELTHDVLCGVVLASRNVRHEREERDAAQRQLAEQKAREQAAHRAMLRARTVAAVCAVLMVLAIAGALFGWLNLRRARTAESQAQDSRANAEKLVSFLIEDFYNELAPTGRLETLGTLARRTVGYYDSLPPDLVTTQTRINRAMALTREASALQSSGKMTEASKDFEKAYQVFDRMHAQGNTSEAVVYGLALTLVRPNPGGYASNSSISGHDHLQQAVDLLKPLAYKQGASERIKLLYAHTLNMISHTQPLEQAVRTCDEGRKLLVDMGALDLSNLDAASSYADTVDSEVRYLQVLGRLDEAEKLEKDIYALVDRLIAKRPGDLHALRVRFLAPQFLAQLALERHQLDKALQYAEKAVQAGKDEVRFNPSDLSSWSDWGGGLDLLAQTQSERGDIRKAITTYQSLLALAKDNHSLPTGYFGRYTEPLMVLQAQMGDGPGARQTLKQLDHMIRSGVIQLFPPGSPERKTISTVPDWVRAEWLLIRNKPHEALAIDTRVLATLQANKPAANSPQLTGAWPYFMRRVLSDSAQASIQLGQFRKAVSLITRWQSIRPDAKVNNLDLPNHAWVLFMQTLRARALVGLGRKEQARAELEPVLSYFRSMVKGGRGGLRMLHDYAMALFVQALASPDDAAGRRHRHAALEQAARLVASAPGDGPKTMMMQDLAGKIARARRMH